MTDQAVATDAQVRAWALANGVACSARGFVPVAVRRAYFAAQLAATSGESAPDSTAYDACGYCGQSVDDWPTRDCEEPLNHRYAPPRLCDCGDEVTVEQSVDSPRQHARCHLIP